MMTRSEVDIKYMQLDNEVEKLAKRKRYIHAIKVHMNGETILDKSYNNYNKEMIHGIYSCTKSILSILIGIAIDKDIIKIVDEKVVDLLPKYKKFFKDGKEKMTLKDLLSMRSGIEWDEFTGFGKNEGIWSEFLSSEDAAECVLSKAQEEKPSTGFNYNSGVSHLLSVIIENNSELTSYEFAYKYLFEPLNIKKEDIEWDVDNKGIVYGGHGLSMKIDDLEKIGIMILNDGVYYGKRIVSRSWIKESTLSHSINTRGYAGYGYQLWKGSISGNDFYGAFGHGGQRVYVFEENDMVITFLGNIKPEFGIQEKIIREFIFDNSKKR